MLNEISPTLDRVGREVLLTVFFNLFFGNIFDCARNRQIAITATKIYRIKKNSDGQTVELS